MPFLKRIDKRIAELTEDWIVQPKSMPQSGLGMLKLNDSAFQRAVLS